MEAEWANLSDGELARETRAGSLRAFEELVYRYEQRIFRFAAQSCYCAADAREITQDTFVKAYQALDQFEIERSFCAWLFAIARRRQIDWFRAAKAHPGQELDEADLPAGGSPADFLAAREEGERIWALARRRLPHAQFEVLWLKYVEDLDIATIAEAVHKSVPHVKILLFRARRVMGKALVAESVREESFLPNLPGSTAKSPGLS